MYLSLFFFTFSLDVSEKRREGVVLKRVALGEWGLQTVESCGWHLFVWLSYRKSLTSDLVTHLVLLC